MNPTCSPKPSIGCATVLAGLLWYNAAAAGTVTHPAESVAAPLAQGTTLALLETRLSRHRNDDAPLYSADHIVTGVDNAMRSPTGIDGQRLFLGVNVGYVGIWNRFDETLRYGAEFRWREVGPWHVRPAGGITIAENDAHYAFLGLRRDFSQSERWVLTASFDAGYFEEGRELELGFDVEFRSGLELAYRFWGGFRAGIALYHLSNGGFGDRNPGTESIVLSLHSTLD